MSSEIATKSLSSRSSVSPTTSNSQKLKFESMKNTVATMRNYLQNGTQDLACLLTRNLQVLSATVDLSIFDPRITMATEFFITLDDLMSKTDSKSLFTWNCVDVLTNACRNSSARLALIHDYQFVISLSRILLEPITLSRRIQLLKLMKDLTCGIKISWQIYHLPPLIKTLAKWVESKEQEVAGLSLGVLVNLCYKNLPVLCTLTSNVDVRALLKNCISIKCPEIEMHTCKLMMICDKLHEFGSSEYIVKLVNVSFISITKAFEKRDYLSLRQLVEFYIDLKENYKLECGNLGELYERKIPILLMTIERVSNSSDAADDSISTSECMSSIFQFLQALLEMKTQALAKQHQKIVQICLGWVHNNVVSPYSMAILKVIAADLRVRGTNITMPLGISLPVLLMVLESVTTEDYLENADNVKKIGALLQLLLVMMRVESLRAKILVELKEEPLLKILEPLTGENSIVESIDVASDSTVLYVHAIALVDEMARHDSHWVSIREQLFLQRQVHEVLSRALSCGPKEVKVLVLRMANLATFPRGQVADLMSKDKRDGFDTFSSNFQRVISEVSGPILQYEHVEKLNEVIGNFEKAIEEKNFADTPISDVMELYEYKVASIAQSERTATAALEAASRRASQLEHRIVQLNNCMNKQNQLLLFTQQRAEESLKSKKEIKEHNQILTKTLESKKYELEQLKHELSTTKSSLAKLQVDYEKINNSKKELEARQEELGRLLLQKDERIAGVEKTLHKKEDALKNLLTTNEDLKSQIAQLKQQLQKSEELVNSKEDALTAAKADLALNKQIIDHITKVIQKTSD